MQNSAAYDLPARLRRIFFPSFSSFSATGAVREKAKTSWSLLASEHAADMAEAEETPILDSLEP